MKRTFDEWLTFLCVAGLDWDEAVQVAREMVAAPLPLPLQ